MTYYRGRWSPPRTRSGRYVGRRERPYGAALWCYVELDAGRVTRFLDLPLSTNRRGCDEAWHLQAAIDAARGTPQTFRVRSGANGATLIDLFSPVPMWARRRWDAMGTPVEKWNSLFAYSFAAVEVVQEVAFMKTCFGSAAR